MTKNSLLHPINELHYGTYKPEDAKEALRVTEKLVMERVAAIEKLSDTERTFENTLLALTRSIREFEFVSGLISHLELVLGEPWRAASRIASVASSRLTSEIGLNVKLYEALIALRRSPAYKIASLPLKKLLNDHIENYKRDGIDLSEAKKKILRELRQKHDEATTRFGQNSDEAMDKAGLHVLDKKELNGLSEDFINVCRQDARGKKLEGYWIQVSFPNYVTVMTDCHIKTTRLAMYKCSRSDGLEPNLPLVKQILKLRYQIANLLGYKNYADYITANRMAKSGQVARDFIDNLQSKYRRGVAAEYNELEAFVREFEGDPELKLHISDLGGLLDFYYASRLRNKKYGFDEQKLREYFALPNVLEGMFEVLSRLYEVTFKRLLDTPVWHEDVQVYAIYDSTNQHIATVWCDWFARKGKRQGAWMNSLYVADRAKGAVSEPHLGQVCANLQPPQAGKPSLLMFNEVRTIWHEFGHFMHLALGRPQLVEQSMLVTEWDFIEAPSQIMENWPWEPEILSIIARHYKTGASLPTTLEKKLLESRNFRVATKATHTCVLAAIDLLLHIEFIKNMDTLDPIAMSHEVRRRAFNIKPEDYDLSLLNFTHIFSGGYAAAYYSYKWASAIQADFFATFKKRGILNPEVGKEYRDTVLSRGSEIRAEEIVRDFLGRDSTNEAMLKRDGLA